MLVCRVTVLYTYVDTVDLDGRCKLDLTVSQQGQLADCFEHGNEYMVSLKWEEYLLFRPLSKKDSDSQTLLVSQSQINRRTNGWMDGWLHRKKLSKNFYSHNIFVLILIHSQNIFSQHSHSKCEMVGPNFESRQVLEIFPFFKMSKLVLKPTQPPIQLVPRFFPRR